MEINGRKCRLKMGSVYCAKSTHNETETKNTRKTTSTINLRNSTHAKQIIFDWINTALREWAGGNRECFTSKTNYFVQRGVTTKQINKSTSSQWRGRARVSEDTLERWCFLQTESKKFFWFLYNEWVLFFLECASMRWCLLIPRYSATAEVPPSIKTYDHWG